MAFGGSTVPDDADPHTAPPGGMRSMFPRAQHGVHDR
jgi:hypothetical protein